MFAIKIEGGRYLVLSVYDKTILLLKLEVS